MTTTPPLVEDDRSSVKCPYCDLETDNQKWLEHHIEYTDRPDHPKIEEYRRQEQQKRLF